MLGWMLKRGEYASDADVRAGTQILLMDPPHPPFLEPELTLGRPPRQMPLS